MAEYYSTSTHYDPVRASTHSHTHSLSHSLSQVTSHPPLPPQQFSGYSVAHQQNIHSVPPLYPMTEPLASPQQGVYSARASSTTTTTAHSPATTTTPMKPKATGRRRKSTAVSKAVESVDDDHPSPSRSDNNNNDNNASPLSSKDNNSPNSSASGNTPRSVHIKTKFPVARIKRIMQADEDVGKVAQVCFPFPICSLNPTQALARIISCCFVSSDLSLFADQSYLQVTPVVVSKALELFMVSLCDKASEEARSRNSKRITAGHLKQAILNEVQFDFLADIIEKVPDIPAAAEGGNLAGNDGSEDGAPVKKTRKPRTRKPKDEDAF
jgi:hypothetical protein